jgi:glycerol-3-phosphate dehydrogenase (NAD(P)+)
MGELADAEALLLVVPAQQVRRVVRGLPPASAPLVIGAKGLEQATGLRLSQVVAEERPGQPVAALSGPSFALEVGRNLPTAVTIAADEPGLAATLAERLASLTFRPYPSDDLLGVELAGALKNVIAIAAGVTMGKGLGENARASLITRGLAEMGRLAQALGARRETLMGLAGLGDLLLTATSLTSRNTSFGHALACGRAARDLLAAGEKLSEGAFTAEAACRLAERVGVELPIAAAVRAVVAGEQNVDAAIGALLSRPLAPTE